MRRKDGSIASSQKGNRLRRLRRQDEFIANSQKEIRQWRWDKILGVMVVCVQEKMLHDAWRRADAYRAELDADGGTRYRLLYSGMPGGSLGPDFRDAVLEATDGSEVQGDVEIHRTAAEWYAHGHDLDGRYGGVVFHAVATGSREGQKTVNGIGIEVPIVDIGGLIGAEIGAGRTDMCGSAAGESARLPTRLPARLPARWGDGSALDEWLDAAGDERFALKIDGQRFAVETFGPDLALQMAVFEGLGYPRNRSGFRQLAKRLPWGFLARYSRLGRFGRASRDVAVGKAEELLRWGAGFGDRPGWVDFATLLGDDPKWVAAAGRPANRPETRLKAAACFVADWWRAGGPLRHALASMVGGVSASQLRDEYVVDGGLVGSGRAGEIVVNAVLPTIGAWAEAGQDRELYAEVLRLYANHPALPSNSVFEEAKRFMGRRGVALGRVRGARRQQGVMHIYKSMLRRPKSPRQMSLGDRVLTP